MLTPLLLVSLSITSSSTLQLVAREAITLEDTDFNVLDFIRLSYQPLLISEALSENTLVALAPWSFPALSSSLEAATTFCIASKGYLSHLDDVRESVTRMKESEDKGNAESEAKEQSEERTKTKKNIEEGKKKEAAETQEAGRNMGSEESVEEMIQEAVPMSLRRFGRKGADDKWLHAFTSITKELGTAVTLPATMKHADLAFLDLTRTGLWHSRAGWAGRGVGGSAVVVCVVEGGLSLALTPLPPSLATLQCAAGQCEATVDPQQEKDIPPDLSFLTRVTAHPRSCLYAPPGWQCSMVALEDTTFLMFAWEDDLVIREDVVDQLFRDEDNEGSTGQGQEEVIEARTLWEALPKGSSPPSLLLWGDQNPLLHLLRRYLLSGRHHSLEAFLQEFIVDRQLMPDLVDCSRECQASAVSIFELLDADGDGELTPDDATLFTHVSFTSLSHQMDDLVDELNDLAREQWGEAVEGPAEARSAFLKRAKERLTASATATVRRWVAGDLEDVDEEALKEHLPSLHEQVLAARETIKSLDKDEL